MNATSVLNKIVTLLAKQEVKMTYAKLEDGTIVESPTFDVGEPVEVVTEEGKTPAPDGEHNLFLKDTEGNEVHIRVITKDGIIVERENVEELEEETKEELILRTNDAEPMEIPRSRVKKRENGTSAMPAMGKMITKRELRDLIEYLGSLKKIEDQASVQ